MSANPAFHIRDLPIEVRRGTSGMALFILTEAMLFVALFFAYYLLGRQQPEWPVGEPPKLLLAFVMLAVLLVSSVVLEWGRREGKAGRDGRARLSLLGTLLLGIVFLGIQALEYADRLKTLTPTQNAYGSIFYAITSFHAVHVTIGLLMLAYALVLPEREPTHRPPHRPHHNAALYWHFVDAVWIVIVVLLYVAPNVGLE